MSFINYPGRQSARFIFEVLNKALLYRSVPLQVQLVALLGVFLILPEFIRGAYFGHHFKLVLNVLDYSFGCCAKRLLQVRLTEQYLLDILLCTVKLQYC